MSWWSWVWGQTAPAREPTLAEAWLAAHRSKLPAFCPDTGNRLSYVAVVVHPYGFDEVTGEAKQAPTIRVQACARAGGRVWDWVPESQTYSWYWAPMDFLASFAADAWEGHLIPAHEVMQGAVEAIG